MKVLNSSGGGIGRRSPITFVTSRERRADTRHREEVIMQGDYTSKTLERIERTSLTNASSNPCPELSTHEGVAQLVEPYTVYVQEKVGGKLTH